MELSRTTRRVVTAVALSCLLPIPALADSPSEGPFGDTRGWEDGRHQSPPNSNGFGVGHTLNAGNPGHTPELDPGVLGSSAVLLVGGTLALRGRRRIESKA